MTVFEAYDCYVFSKRKKGLKTTSLDDVDYCLRGFIRAVGADLDIQKLSQRMVDDYIMSLYSKSLAKATIATYIRYLRLFLMFVNSHYGLSFSPETIEIPKSPKKKVRLYSASDVVLIFKSITSSVSWITARNRAIIALMLDSGLRQCEIVSLHYSDISFSASQLRVHGKGDKERYCLLGNISARYLREYFVLCPYSNNDYVFCSDDGSQITGNAIRIFVSRLASSLPFELSSHKLRHNFATNYVIQKSESGLQVDAYTLKLLMGHESIVTTEGYIHCAMEALAVKSSISYLDSLSGLP